MMRKRKKRLRQNENSENEDGVRRLFVDDMNAFLSCRLFGNIPTAEEFSTNKKYSMNKINTYGLPDKTKNASHRPKVVTFKHDL